MFLTLLLSCARSFPCVPFPTKALINNKPRARTVVAREATELLALSRKDFQNILGSVKSALQKEAGYRVLKTW